MITLDTVRSFPMFSLMRRAVPETAAMQRPIESASANYVTLSSSTVKNQNPRVGPP
jgi:hypothetical protein